MTDEQQWGVTTMTYTADKITELPANGIFVFGSNVYGIHGKGAALDAYKLFGAVPGCGEGPTGRSYAIPTRDGTPPSAKHRSWKFKTLSLETIQGYIQKFLEYAKSAPDKVFYVTQIGCGYAGYGPKQIAPLFFHYDIPSNVILPKPFVDVGESERPGIYRPALINPA